MSLRIVFSGMVAGVPGQGGAAWAVLQYVLGLRRLGHDVVLVEPVDELAPASVAYLREISSAFALEGRAALLRRGTRETAGVDYDRLVELSRSADLLVNVSGMLEDERMLDPIRTRVYLDLDPAFVQLWQAACGIDMRFDAHTHFVSVGQALGDPACPVPTCGRRWLPTLQPVVLDEWPAANGAGAEGPVTTVANWRGYGSIEHEGVFYGQKAHSFRPLADLPLRTTEPLVLALSIHPDETGDLAALARSGWRLVDPGRVTATPADYRRFVQRSRAELGIAKSGYVASRCGWFSDRSACYLASGRPVIAQETGFSGFLPTGRGLLSFATLDDAVAGLEALASDYAGHARAARELAVEHFDSDRVLTRLLERL